MGLINATFARTRFFGAGFSIGGGPYYYGFSRLHIARHSEIVWLGKTTVSSKKPLLAKTKLGGPPRGRHGSSAAFAADMRRRSSRATSRGRIGTDGGVERSSSMSLSTSETSIQEIACIPGAFGAGRPERSSRVL